ncbi:dockerin type I repeat-containing protein [Oscillibacter sp. MSJ-31]|uniref:dockerin type I repeat-containing protein n=1 Tax=Oscillibacter sp. MSJ-31 TaxID=2841526 RepID=UPI001C101D11|nr:dockerin type I repeat-containing protein [Oscillibacter sp. MSJ-31]MBU5456208.1 dockerin type I repeat-containing protein [Oscillibacter sp. MSJ-31]
MKRLLRSLLLAAVLTAALCVGALAAEPTVAGIYGVTDGNGVTLTPQEANENTITPDKTQEGYDAYYANAVRFGVEKTGLTKGTQYLLLVVKGTEAPSEKNIVYIDQRAADSSGKVSFNAYPSSLTKDDYRVYVVGENSAYSQGTPTASFSYYQPYTLGDVNGDEIINASDALLVLKFSAKLETLTDTQKLAANVTAHSTGDDIINASDALMILKYSAKLITGWD